MELSLVVVIAYTVWISIELSNNFGDYAYLTGRRFLCLTFLKLPALCVIQVSAHRICSGSIKAK